MNAQPTIDSPTSLEDVILSLCAGARLGRTIDPSEAAHAYAAARGEGELGWRSHLQGVRTAAVKLAESKGVALDQLALSELQAIDPRITEAVYPALSVEASVASRASHGGTAPDQVRCRVADAARALGV